MSILPWVNLTYECIFSCPHCYSCPSNDHYFMSDEVFSDIMNLLSDMAVRRMLFSGGEPTLHPKFISMLARCKSMHIKSMVNSNGLAFADPTFTETAIGNGLSLANISLKAVNRNDFVSITGFDGFELQCKAIRNLISYQKLSLIVSLTLNRYLMENFREAIDLMQSLGVKSTAVNVAKAIEGSDHTGGGTIVSDKEAVEFIIDNSNLLSDSGLDYTLRLDMPLCLFRGKGMNKRLSMLNVLTNCFFRNNNSLIFDPHGNLIPCNIMTSEILGKIGTDFSTAAEYRAFLHRHDIKERLDGLKGREQECESCELSHKCCRGCSAMKRNTGNYFVETGFCYG